MPKNWPVIIWRNLPIINERIEEHRKDVAKSKATSNVYLHVQSTDHTFDFSNVKFNLVTLN